MILGSRRQKPNRRLLATSAYSTRSLQTVRVTCTAHGTRGDVWPTVALGVKLAERDHDVTIAVPEEFREFVERAGLRVAPLPFNIMSWLSAPEGQRLLHTGGIPLMRRVQQEYRRYADAFDDAFEQAAQGAEALVGMYLTWDRTLVMGDLLRVPMAVVYPQQYAPSREYSSVVLTKGRLRSPHLRLASHKLTDRIWWQGSAETTNAFRRKLGLRTCRQSTFSRLQGAGALGLHIVSPSVFPRPNDWPEHLKLTGAWQMPEMLREGLDEGLPADLQAWLDDGDPPIFLGFGSMPVLDPDSLLEDIVSVTSTLGKRGIISENCVSPRAAGMLPDHLRVVGAVDHDRLFPQCAAVVHHGGAGTVAASLRAGCPTMVCSVLADQPWWGERMRRLGVGCHERFCKLDRAALAAGLCTLLDPDVIARASTLGAAIRAEGDGLAQAAQLLEDWLVVAEPTPPVRTRAPWRGSGRVDPPHRDHHDLDAGRSPRLRTLAELPGPPRLPLIGNAHQLIRTSRAHLTAEGLARRYGPIVRVDIGRRRIVGISDADEINTILRNRPDGFRRWSEQQVILDEMSPRGVFAAEGDEWKRQRKLIITALNTNHLHRYFQVIRTTTERLHRRLTAAARDGRVLNISEELTSYTVDITSALAFGHDLNTLEHRDNELQQHIQCFFATMARRIAAPVPYWRWIRLRKDRAFDRSMAELQRACAGFIEQARERMARRPELHEQPENLLEAMLAQQAEGTFTEEEIIGNALTILTAGEDTTAHTLGWTIWFLASRPDIQTRLAQEANENLGEHLFAPDYETTEGLRFAEAVIRESMRLKTVGPLLAIEPLVDTTICDTHIPAGTRLLLLLRQAGFGQEPASRFDPDWWLDEDQAHAPKSLVFGAGPRFCPGRNLAFLESRNALAMVARNFVLELDQSSGPVTEHFNFAMMPKGLRVHLHERAAP